MKTIPQDIDEIIKSDNLLERASNGDNAAFKKIYDAISGKMYSLCIRYAGQVTDANDIFQEGFVKLYRNLGNFRGEGSFEGWARRIFVNTCLDFLKKRKVGHLDIDDTNVVEINDDDNIYDKLSIKDLMNLVKNLPDNYRTVINLYAVEGYSHKEISSMFNITENGSKSWLHKARLYLKRNSIGVGVN